MPTFLDMLTGEDSVHLEKCGDVVVSPKDNVFALFCHFCRDMFATNLPEFLRHLQSVHCDVLHFTKEHNVYSVEELLAGTPTQDTDAQSQADSSCSGDSGMPAENDDTLTADRENKRDILAEVEAMLFEDTNNFEEQLQNEISNNTVELNIASNIESKATEPAVRETLELLPLNAKQIEPNLNQALYVKEQKSRVKTKCVISEKTMSKELHLPFQTDLNNKLSHESKFLNNMQYSPTVEKLKSQINNSQSNGVVEKYTQHLISSIDKTSGAKIDSWRNVKSHTIQRSSGKREMQQRMNQIKNRILKTLHTEDVKKNRNKVHISHVEILPPIDKSLHKNILEKAIKSLSDANQLGREVKTKNISQESIQNVKSRPILQTSAIALQKHIIPKSEIRKNVATYDKRNKENECAQISEKPKTATKTPRQKRKQSTSNAETLTKRIKVESNIDSSLLDTALSETVIDLPQVLKSEEIKSEGLCKSTDANEDQKSEVSAYEDLLSQVKQEQPKTPKSSRTVTVRRSSGRIAKISKSVEKCVNSTTPTRPTDDKDPIASLPDDMDLLKAVGLATIAMPNYEDNMELDEQDKLRDISKKFAKVMAKYEIIWNFKGAIAAINSLVEEKATLLTKEINDALGTTFGVAETKRICNLINMWFSQSAEEKLCNKTKLSASFEYYFKLFVFLPIVRHRFYCEFCPKHFVTVDKYADHRETHIGAIQCSNCAKTFKKCGNYMNHTKKCTTPRSNK
ncbi:protein teflon isoform X2 [Scaptodrosophila lebanonensis]|uniref:Protein teflon isoform X2 n=1 Tax=Drosophila lebanonensis TaxID=7225 RepID=A0A6J2UJ70_DROLE|nr:protein teflon isoform X2 [Scaptodrosophila lebanonensis]